MIENDNLLKEAEKEVKKQQILMFVKKHKFSIIAFILVILVIIGILFGYNSHNKSMANKDSISFSLIQDTLIKGKNEEAIKLLQQLQKEGTNGYKMLAYFQDASLALYNKKPELAISTLNKLNSNVKNLPKYYLELARYISLSIRLDYDKNTVSVIDDINKELYEKNTFYNSNLLLYTLAFMKVKNYKSAIENATKIINNDKAPSSLKEFAKNIKSVAQGYVN